MFLIMCSIGWVKERAEIDKMRSEIKVKERELEMKQKLFDADDEDGALTINIIRGHKEDV